MILLTPDEKREYQKGVNDLFEYYGVGRHFEIKKLLIIKKRGLAQIYTLMIAFHLLKIRPDFVYGRYFHGCCIAALMGYKTIQESHFKDWKNSKIKKYILEYFAKSVNVVRFVVITEALKASYLKQFPGLSKKMIVAQDGADICSSDASGLESQLDKTRLQVEYTGHFYEGRGINVILQVAEKLPDVDFHIVGGRDEDVVFWESKNLPSNIQFHGFVAPRLVSDYQRQFDVLLAPYMRKVLTNANDDTSMCMSPLKIFEYMAIKKPIVASDLPVLREILNETNSMLVNPDDADEWVDAINELRDKKHRRKLAEQNADSGFCESKFVRPRSVKNLLRTFRHIAQKRNHGLQESIRHSILLLKPKHDRIHTHWSQYSRRWNESNLWDSWFRVLTLARIEVALGSINNNKVGVY